MHFTSFSSISYTFIDSLNISHHLSFDHYYVQSLAPKLDVLHAELFHFDILAFNKTWLNSSFSTNNIRLHSFNCLERKDRVGDSHGGIIIITKTRLYSFDPLKPHFYTVKLGFIGVCINFLISVQKRRLWVLVRTASPRFEQNLF